MGTCCSTKPHEPCPSVQPSLGQHHSLLVHAGTNSGVSNGYGVVYRPPHLNQRLAPGEARPKFWLSPTLPSPPAQPIVSVAWTQHPRHQTQTQQQQQQEEKEEQWQQQQQQRQIHSISRLAFRLRSPTRAIRWPKSVKGGSQPPALPVPSTEETMPEGSVVVGCVDLCLAIRAYPPFLLPYVDKILRIRLVFTDPHVQQMVGEHGHLKHGTGTLEDGEVDPMMEISHLVRNVHSLKVQFRHSVNLQGLPDMTVVESHGGVKRLRRVRYRVMPVTWIDLDHRKPAVKAVGQQFELTLGPPSTALTSDDFYDGNGETPTLLGTYERTLDTCPERRLLFSARLYRWFNQQAAPQECCSDLSDICEQATPTLGALR